MLDSNKKITVIEIFNFILQRLYEKHPSLFVFNAGEYLVSKNYVKYIWYMIKI